MRKTAWIVVAMLWSILSGANMCAAGDGAKADIAPPTSTAGVPKAVTLDAALETWIVALEKDDSAAAAKLTADDKAAKALEGYWKNLKAAHAAHDYRKWLAGAKEATATFKVGGHKFNHMHVDWEKTDAGWRIKSVSMCR